LKYPGDIPRYPGDIPEISRRYPEDILAGYPGNIPEISLRYPGDIPEISRSPEIPKILWDKGFSD